MRKMLLIAVALCIIQTLLPINSFAQGLKPGDAAVDFNLKNVDGKMVSLSALQDNKGAIVIFTCNHCPFSIAYEDRIIALHQRYSQLGYPVIAINPNDPSIAPGDSYDKMIERAAEKKFPFVYLYDETQKIASSYGASRTPHVYLLQKEGNSYKVAYIGAIDDNTEDVSAVKKNYVQKALGELMAGKPVSEPSTKAIGCSIKWKK